MFTTSAILASSSLPEFTPGGWALLAGVAFLGVLGSIFPIAVQLRNDDEMRTLKRRVATLQAEQVRKLRELAASSVRVTKVHVTTGLDVGANNEAMVKSAKKAA